VFCFFLFFSFLSFLCCCQEQLQGIKLPGLPATPKVHLIVVCLGFFVKILFIAPTTHCQIVPFFSSLRVWLPLAPVKDSGAFVESYGPFLRSEGTFDCRLLQFFFGRFLAEQTSGTHTKTPFLLPIFFPSLHRQYRRAFGCWKRQKGHFQTEKVSFECIFDVVFVTTIAWTILITITNLSLFF